MEEHVSLLKERRLPVPKRNPNPTVTIQNAKLAGVSMNAKPTFIEIYVKEISKCLQNHMRTQGIRNMSPRDCAELLDSAGILKSDLIGHPDRGFMFRKLLRDGRDGIIPLVTGATWDGKHWSINKE